MLPGYFAQQVAPLCPHQVAPFCRTLTTTTDWQTSLLVESDGHELGELHETYPRVQGHSIRRGKTYVGEERRVQELYVGLDSTLLEVIRVGLITCVGAGLVIQVHTHFVRSAQQVVHELQVQEEVEGVRQEVREVKGESEVEERRSLHEHVDDMDDKHKTHDLSHGECAWDVDTVLTNEKKRDNARSHSDIVEVSENGHVVTGVRIVQCYHAIMDVVIGVRIV